MKEIKSTGLENDKCLSTKESHQASPETNAVLLALKMHLTGTTSAKTNLSELESQKHCFCLKIIVSSCTHAQKHENDISAEFEKRCKR